MADANTLLEKIRQKVGDIRFVVVSNREPYIHQYREGSIEWIRPASGMASGLEPIMLATSGTWVASGTGSADHEVVDEKGRIPVPPGDPKFTLKRLWLTKEEEEGFYYGFSNATMWPLCHVVYVRPTFESQHWDAYRRVNEKYAAAILDEIGDEKAFVWIQDFHLALLPKILKDARPDLLVAQFWHVPWPTPEIFRLCPWKHEILWGLLANDLLGFHIRYHCDNFLASAELELEIRVDRERSSIFSSGHETRIRPLPISVDFESISAAAEGEPVRETIRRFRTQLGLRSEIIALGIDRFDYTKGIPERIRAVDRFLELFPEYRERFVLFQTGPISRLHVKEYKHLNDEVNALAEQVNWKHGTKRWMPINLVRRHMNAIETTALYRMADICVVSSLHDGLNLVAKEFVAARTDEDGVLLLSRLTGAARELEHAVLINPYDTDGFAEAIGKAVQMPEEERRQRMRKLREIVREHNVYDWAEQFITELTRIA